MSGSTRNLGKVYWPGFTQVNFSTTLLFKDSILYIIHLLIYNKMLRVFETHSIADWVTVSTASLKTRFFFNLRPYTQVRLSSYNCSGLVAMLVPFTQVTKRTGCPVPKLIIIMGLPDNPIVLFLMMTNFPIFYNNFTWIFEIYSDSEIAKTIF